MKVKNLIEFLEMVDPEKEVVLHNFNGEPVMFVLSAANQYKCCLETESDVSMKAEIKARFDFINKNPEIEEEMYRIMIRQGITSDVVERFNGKEYADRMRKFCKEHNVE